MSSCGSPPANSSAAARIASSSSSGSSRGAARDRLDEPLLAEQVAAAAALGDAVGVEDQRRRPGASSTLTWSNSASTSTPISDPVTSRTSTEPSARATIGGGWPPTRDRRYARSAPSSRMSKRATAIVQKRSPWSSSRSTSSTCASMRGGLGVAGARAERVARGRGQRRGLGSLAADVGDHRVRRAAGDEHVVDVAADLHPLARRAVARRDLERRRCPGGAPAAASAAASARCRARARTGGRCRSRRAACATSSCSSATSPASNGGLSREPPRDEDAERALARDQGARGSGSTSRARARAQVARVAGGLLDDLVADEADQLRALARIASSMRGERPWRSTRPRSPSSRSSRAR